jgi:hypothetical protein
MVVLLLGFFIGFGKQLGTQQGIAVTACGLEVITKRISRK